MSLTKIKITGKIQVKTGLHIGGDDSFSAIGAIDLPVVRDPLTRKPIIPGSTLKGKMRSLLARDMGSVPAKGVNGFRNDCDEIKRLFGSTAEKADDGSVEVRARRSRLQFSDCFLTGENWMTKKQLTQVCETKFENTIDRLTSVANPRQIERVVRGAEFALELIYDVEEPDELAEDFANIRNGFMLLENDYLGGGGTRGNGRVQFADLHAEAVTGDLSIRVPSLA